MPNSVLKKKALTCSYHRVREAVASGVMRFTNILLNIIKHQIGPVVVVDNTTIKDKVN